jgi:coenzyme F420 hydrogenase subunit beta
LHSYPLFTCRWPRMADQGSVPKAKVPTSTTKAIEAVVGNGFCTGCGLCESLAPKGAIEMKLSELGYLRPAVVQADKVDALAVFSDTCPGKRIEHVDFQEKRHPLWGPLIAVRAGHSTDPEIRREGSSGGVVSALAIHLLDSGAVAFVAQIAVDHTDPLRNEMQISRSRADVLRAAGSRYSPSAPLRHLRELLDRNEKFAFVGKPCDVAALRRYALHDERVNALVPYMISFMCAGIPSMAGTHELLREFGVEPPEVRSFRYRGDGWPGNARAVTNDGRSFEMDYNRSWGTILGKHLQFRCKICPDGTGEFADLVCADAWYGESGYPDFTERDGRSLVIARTRKGEALIGEAMAAGVVALDPLPVDDVALMQPYQAQRKRLVLGRSIATRIARGVRPEYRRMGLLRASVGANAVAFLRHAWGTMKRANGESGKIS